MSPNLCEDFHFRRSSIIEAVPTDNWETPLHLLLTPF